MTTTKSMTVITFYVSTPIEYFHQTTHRFHEAVNSTTRLVRIMATQNGSGFAWYIETPSEHAADMLDAIRSHFGDVKVQQRGDAT